MSALRAEWLADTVQILPLSAMKAVTVPATAGPFMPRWVWPWLVFGALALLLYYVFRR